MSDQAPTISEALDVLRGIFKPGGSHPTDGALRILFADCDHGRIRDILYAFLGEPRPESRDERADRMARDAAAWGPTALANIVQGRRSSEVRSVEPRRVGAHAAEMAAGAKDYFGGSS